MLVDIRVIFTFYFVSGSEYRIIFFFKLFSVLRTMYSIHFDVPAEENPSVLLFFKDCRGLSTTLCGSIPILRHFLYRQLMQVLKGSFRRQLPPPTFAFPSHQTGALEVRDSDTKRFDLPPHPPPILNLWLGMDQPTLHFLSLPWLKFRVVRRKNDRQEKQEIPEGTKTSRMIYQKEIFFLWNIFTSKVEMTLSRARADPALHQCLARASLVCHSESSLSSH